MVSNHYSSAKGNRSSWRSVWLQGQGKVYKVEAGMACGVKKPKNIFFFKKKTLGLLSQEHRIQTEGASKGQRWNNLRNKIKNNNIGFNSWNKINIHDIYLYK